ncbi:choice-of-anchor J domain-containing protein [Flavobacterium cerinum]|uniref:T9SS type B sorting domain-containing protein n=1 Tax=Flavobacterium cerinum TaxID=2502784 RepID=A0A3S3QEX4_9FLAO|nr:choice-of-anchor J domain-containing protein [Flavobacterium cerinum]RWW91641.1 T9SS type B sorting domain-containing protein [Flavobacterium cerinum]
MKKITLMIMASLLSFCGYAQFPEGFETGFTLASTGTSATGWFTMQNEVGLSVTWVQGAANSTVQQPAHTGARAAYLQRDLSTGGIPKDYLVTPVFTVPADPEIHFFSRLTQLGDQGSIYKIFILNLTATPMADLNSPASYTELQTWTELQINPDQTSYTEKTVAIPASYIGAQVRIAFMMAGGGTNSDRWLIDDVTVVKKCERPTALTAANIGLNSADLSWTNPGDATAWDIEIVPEAAVPTGVPTHTYSGTMPFQVPAGVLTQDTCYKYYVRSNCGVNGKSDWQGAFYFCTKGLGDTCAAPLVVASLPFTDTDNTNNFGDEYEGEAGTGCNADSWENYLSGNDVIYKYVAAFTGEINIDLTNTSPYAGMFIYASCADIGVTCLNGGTGDAISLDGFDVTAGEDYYIVVSSSNTEPIVPYTLTIQAVACDEPVGSPAANIGMTSVELSWTNPTGATSWGVAVQPKGTGVPQGNGSTITDNTNYIWGDLTPSTDYEYWVRADCNNGTFSAWAGPYYFNTMLCEVANQCSFTFHMSGVNNSWEGHTMSVKQNGITLAILTGPDNDGTPVDVNIPLCNGVPVQLFWNQGGNSSANNDIRINIRNSFDQIIYEKEPDQGFPNTVLYESAVDCNNPYCTKPILSVTNITQTSADLNWDGPATFEWEYVVQSPGAGAPTGSGTNTAAHQHHAPGLTENTSYEFYVRASCGDGEFSQWAGPMVFKTLCSPVNAPFTEGFNSDSSTQNCWIIQNINGEAAWNLDDTSLPFEGDEVATLDPMFMSGNIDRLITPAINITANQRLRFHQRTSGFFGAGCNFKVMLSTTGIDPEDFTVVLIPSATYNNSMYVEHEIFLDAIPAGTIHIAWIFEGGTAGLSIDNVIIDPIPPCPAPEELNAANFTNNSAVLSWKPGFTETTWDIVIQAPGTGVPTGTGISVSNPHTAEDLAPNTAYEYYVRAACGGTNGNSEWVGPYEFRTTCNTYNVPFHESFNSDSQSVYCWEILDINGGQDQWITNSEGDTYEGDRSARYASEFSNLNNDWLISPGIILTGNERLTYQYKVYRDVYPVTIKVMLSTTGTNPADFTEVLVPVANYSNMDYTKKVIDLTAYTGTVYIAWQGPQSNNSDGMFFYLDDVKVEAIPACADPYDLVVNTITANTAKLSWTPGNNETQWEIVVKPSTSGAPTEPGIITGNNPYTVEGLLSGTSYAFYIRSVCGATKSPWNGPKHFITAITNDECANAINVPVNTGIDCVVVKGGTLHGATQSPQPSTCIGTPEDDVWFEFTATAVTHNITLLNISEFNSLHFAIYSGECENLVNLACDSFTPTLTVEGLTIGQTYKIRVYSTNPSVTMTFDICVRNVMPPIAVNNTTYTVQQLVTDVLINSDCAQVSNITYSTGINFTNEQGEIGPNGIAHFKKNGSLFVLEEGIVLSTGDAMRSPGPETDILQDGDISWTGDDDLDAIVLEATGAPMDSKNATILEFDFVPLIETISFDFLFASEEYGDFQCDFSDSFAFLLTDSAGTTTNLAVVPGTTSPVSVVTIRDKENNKACESVNPEYFERFNGSILNSPVAAINYQGYTVPMKARATVTPNTTYHIKMVIADRLDTRYDSAIFLGAGSFNIGGASLGLDLTIADGTAICAGQTHTLLSGMSPVAFTFKWFKNGILIEGETSPSLVVSEPGEYTIEARIAGSDCLTSDSVVIEFYPPVEGILGTPKNLVRCSTDGKAKFNLTDNDIAITGTNDPSKLIITYHLTKEDATAGINPLASPYENTSEGQTIYASIVYKVTVCKGILSFTLNTSDSPVITSKQGCENGNYTLEVVFDPKGTLNAGNVTVAWTNKAGTVIGTNAKVIVENTGIYKVTIAPIGDEECISTTEVNVESVSCNIPRGISPNGDGMNDEFDLSGFGVRELKIFNRYGQEVYSKSNYTKEWHGQGGNGNELPTGTYYYMIDALNSKTITGWVYINREE